MKENVATLAKYTIKSDGDFLMVNNRKMIVKDKYGFTYQLNKTFIGHQNNVCRDGKTFKTAAQSLADQMDLWRDKAEFAYKKIGRFVLVPPSYYWFLQVADHVMKYGKEI